MDLSVVLVLTIVLANAYGETTTPATHAQKHPCTTRTDCQTNGFHACSGNHTAHCLDNFCRCTLSGNQHTGCTTLRDCKTNTNPCAQANHHWHCFHSQCQCTVGTPCDTDDDCHAHTHNCQPGQVWHCQHGTNVHHGTCRCSNP